MGELERLANSKIQTPSTPPSESPVQRYNREILLYCDLIPIDEKEQAIVNSIISNPEEQTPGFPMPTRIIRKKMDVFTMDSLMSALERKVQMEIPVVEDTQDTTSLEGIDPRDLRVGNIILIKAASMRLADFNGIRGGGWYFEPNLHVVEVTRVPNRYSSTPEFGVVRLKNVPIDYKFYTPISSGEGDLWKPFIAKGAPLGFMGGGGTASIQALYLFRNREGFMREAAKAGLINSPQLPPEQHQLTGTPNSRQHYLR